MACPGVTGGLVAVVTPYPNCRQSVTVRLNRLTRSDRRRFCTGPRSTPAESSNRTLFCSTILKGRPSTRSPSTAPRIGFWVPPSGGMTGLVSPKLVPSTSAAPKCTSRFTKGPVLGHASVSNNCLVAGPTLGIHTVLEVAVGAGQLLPRAPSGVTSLRKSSFVAVGLSGGPARPILASDPRGAEASSGRTPSADPRAE